MKFVEGSRAARDGILKKVNTDNEFLVSIKEDRLTVAVFFTNQIFPHPAIQRETLDFLRRALEKFENVYGIWGFTDEIKSVEEYIPGFFRPVYLFFGSQGVLLYRVSGYTLTDDELITILDRLVK